MRALDIADPAHLVPRRARRSAPHADPLRRRARASTWSSPGGMLQVLGAFTKAIVTGRPGTRAASRARSSSEPRAPVLHPVGIARARVSMNTTASPSRLRIRRSSHRSVSSSGGARSPPRPRVIGYGVSRRSWPGLLLAAGAAPLAYRGATGRWPAGLESLARLERRHARGALRLARHQRARIGPARMPDRRGLPLLVAPREPADVHGEPRRRSPTSAAAARTGWRAARAASASSGTPRSSTRSRTRCWRGARCPAATSSAPARSPSSRPAATTAARR